MVSRLAKTRKRRVIPAENLTDDIRVEDEARHSGVDGTQAHARATQHGVEVLPPLLDSAPGSSGWHHALEGAESLVCVPLVLLPHSLTAITDIKRAQV